MWRRRLKRFAILCVVAGAAVLYVHFRYFRGGSSAEPALAPADAARLLVNRNWLDVMPHDEHERLHVYRFTPAMGGGVFQDRTLYAGQFELFKFTVLGDKLDFSLPHKGEHLTTTYEIRRVRGHEPFDLELTLARDPRGPSHYYGFSKETAAEADVDTLLADHRAP
jgi:hypothetical protein